MLIYLSDRKIENLYTEFNISRSLIERIMPRNIKPRVSTSIGDITVEGEYDLTDSNRTTKVLKKLNGKKSAIELVDGQIYIKPLSYYVCDGLMSYQKRIDGHIAEHQSSDIAEKYRPGDNQFFPDDILEFNIKISHDRFKTLNIKCTADSIRVFGAMNLAAHHPDEFTGEFWVKHPNSGDPGLLTRKLPVRVIFWCLNTNESTGIVYGTPVMISC